MKVFILFLIIAPIMLVIENKLIAQEFLRAELNKLVLNGREYRAIGFNKPDLFTSYSADEIFGQSSENNELKQKTISAIIDAEKNKICFG